MAGSFDVDRAADRAYYIDLGHVLLPLGDTLDRPELTLRSVHSDPHHVRSILVLTLPTVAKVKEGRLIHERRKPIMKIIAAAAFVAAPWQPAHAQAIVGSIPEEFRGDWCQESTKDNIFKPGGCKLKAGSLSIDRTTLDTGRLSCGFDSGTVSDGTLQMRMLCTDPEDKESLMYGAQLKLLPGKKIELILEPMDQK
jgi:hypothetical protein